MICTALTARKFLTAAARHVNPWPILGGTPRRSRVRTCGRAVLRKSLVRKYMGHCRALLRKLPRKVHVLLNQGFQMPRHSLKR